MENNNNAITNARQAFQQAVNPPQPPTTSSQEKFQKLLMSPLGQAGFGGLVVMVFLFILNPPMVQSKKNSDIEHPQKDFRKILAYSGISAALILIIPKLYQRCQNSFKS